MNSKCRRHVTNDNSAGLWISSGKSQVQQAQQMTVSVSSAWHANKLLHLHPRWLQNYVLETEFCVRGQSWCAWCWYRTGTCSVQQGRPVSSLWIWSAENSMSIHKLINVLHYSLCVVPLLLLLLLVFSPWAGLGRDQSSVRRLVWLWYAASWASS